MRHCLCFLSATTIMLAGCAAPLVPGRAGDVHGPITSIELYTSRPERGALYRTFPRQTFFASDRELYVLSHWDLPKPGEYTSKLILHPPTQGGKQESEYRFRAESRNWMTFQRLVLPSGESAKAIAGEWQVEVSLDGTPVGKRMFRFDAASIRLRTDSHLFITEGLGDPGGTGGGYRWTQDFSVREAAQQSAKIAGHILRDEMARRFPRVSGPGPSHEAPDASILIRPVLRSSPNLSSPCLLELEIADPAKKQSRKFVFQTMAGVDRVGELGTRYFSVDAADLAFQAASSPEVIDFLIRTTSATPE